MFNLSKVDSFPELTRSGRVSNELQSIIDALVASAEQGEKFAISGVEAGKAYNSMQQRIRAQAKKLNFKVIIRYDADDQKLYFKATSAAGNTKVDVKPVEEVTPEVKTSEVKGIKSKAAVK